MYECQINTEPKMSLLYTLNIVGQYSGTSVPRAFVLQLLLLLRGLFLFISEILWEIKRRVFPRGEKKTKKKWKKKWKREFRNHEIVH